MRISELISELQAVQAAHGDILVQISQREFVLIPVGSEKDQGKIINIGHFFVVAEEYHDGWWCSLRDWPY